MDGFGVDQELGGKPEKCTTYSAASTQRFHGFFICLESPLGVYKKEISSLATTRSIAVFNRRTEALMPCPSCGSGNQTEFTAEMIIHSSGLRNLDKPGVWIFSKVLVCLDCGCSHFTVPARELASIAKDTREDKSSTLESSAGDVPLSGGIASQVGS
jgi:hypothetical protein